MNKQELINKCKNEEDKLLVSKILDKIKLAKTKNQITNTEFLDMYQKKVTEEVLQAEKYENYIYYYPCENAEKTMLVIYPEKYAEIFNNNKFNFSQFVKLIRVMLPKQLKGQYVHKDYLSGVMKLGVRREKIGDIFVFEDGADIVLHSATKYLAGHNDVLAGVVVTDNADLYEKLFYNLNTTGAVLSPFDSYQLIRGLKTLSLRMERSTANAQEIVAFLEQSPAVKEVLYTGRGGMISFKVADEKRIPHILNTLKVFSFAESLGGVESLITYPTTQTHADIPAEVRHSYGLTDDLLRLSIGIEDARDLIEDLRQALEG